MKVAHRDAPVGHAAARIENTNLCEILFRFFVFEGMEPGDGPIKLLLRFGRTGGVKVDAAEVSRFVLMLVSTLRVGSKHTSGN